MAKKYMTLVTNRGRQKIMKAAATGKKVAINKIKIGDGNGSSYEIDESMTKLKHVVYETNIANFKQDPLNPNTILVESLIPSDVGGFYIREIGLYDDEGDLIVLTSYEETYKPVAEEGSTMELFIRIALVLTNTNAVTIVIDSSAVFVTQADLDKVYKLIGDLGTASGEFSDTGSIVIMLRELRNDIGDVKKLNLDGYDERPESEGGFGKKNLTNIVKALWKKLSTMELTDEKITVTSDGNKTLKEVLKGIIKSIKEVKDAEILDRKSINTLNNELTGVDTLLKDDNEKFAQLLGVNIEDIRGGI